MYNVEKSDELLLVWKNSITRDRIVIGRLWKEAGKFHFKYIRECENERGSIEKAIKMGYKSIKIFEDIDEKYTSDELFAPFLNRLNGKDRKGEPFEVLKRTGGRLSTDTLEFMKPVDELEKYRTVKFNIAAWSHYEGQKALKGLEVGQKLHLEIEKDNIYDVHAIEVWTTDGNYKLGYVPAVYSRYVDKLVENGEYEAVIDNINPEAGPYEIVEVKFSGKMVNPKVEETKISIA